MTQHAQDGEPVSAMIPTETVRGDVRNVPPSKQWLRLLQDSSGDKEALRAFARSSSEQAHLQLGRQDLSWSVTSLLEIAGVADRFSALVSSTGALADVSGGRSRLSDEVDRSRALKLADRKARREAYVAGKAAGSAKK